MTLSWSTHRLQHLEEELEQNFGSVSFQSSIGLHATYPPRDLVCNSFITLPHTRLLYPRHVHHHKTPPQICVTREQTVNSHKNRENCFKISILILQGISVQEFRPFFGQLHATIPYKQNNTETTRERNQLIVEIGTNHGLFYVLETNMWELGKRF